MYDWVVAGCGGDSSRVVVWGHSLGTGVAGHLVSLLCLESNNPAGLVLESPFNNIADEVRNHPMCWVWSKMPWFDWFFTECLADNDVGFVTDQRLAVIDCPVLILHAEDDAVVPYKLGLALYESAQQVTTLQHSTNNIWENTIKTYLQSRPADWRQLQFQGYSADLGYAHKYICRDPHLPALVR